MCIQYLARTFRHEKTIGKKGTAYVLIINHKRFRVIISKQCSDLYKCNLHEFLQRFVIVDGIWVCYYTSETKEQSKHWIFFKQICTKESKKKFLGRKSYDHNIPGLERQSLLITIIASCHFL